MSNFTGCHYLYEESTKEDESCTLIYYQSGLQESNSKVLFDLLEQIIFEPLMVEIQKKELGFVYKCNVQRQNGVQGFMIIVQSKKHPRYVEEKIDDSLRAIKVLIINYCKHISIIVQTLKSCLHCF